MSLLLTLVGCLSPALAGPARSDALVVDDFACFDQNGAFQRLSRHADARFIVLYVYANECPIVRHNSQELNALIGEFEPRVRFLGLDPASQDERAEIAAEAAVFGLHFPILIDDTQCVAEMLQLTRTGEALVVSTKSWELLWRGPLDDRLEYGAQKPSAKRRYLHEALEALLKDEAPPDNVPLAKGCAITYLEPRERHVVAYARDVAPILTRRCLPCHREGGIGPWSMDGFKRVRGFGAMMRDVLLQRRMSPWLVDPEYGDFQNPLAVGADEVRTIIHWVEQGAPRGDGPDPLAVAADPLPEWPLGEPDLVVEVPEQKIPATGLVPYRNYSVDLDLDTDRWVRAVDLRPSNPKVLHHAFAFIRGRQEVDVFKEKLARLPEAGRARIEKRLEELGRTSDNPPEQFLKGLERLAFHGIYTYFSKYTPGEGLEPFPDGAGKLLPAGSTLTFQMHYTSIGAATSDRPRLGLYFYDEKPPKELKVTTALNTGFMIPPGERSHPVSAERVFDREFKMYAVSPHMHYRGRSMRYLAVLPSGEREVLFSLPEYQFDWQTTYTLSSPRVFPAGTRIVCEGTFDNSMENESNPNAKMMVRFGPRTVDEMFIGYVIYTEE